MTISERQSRIPSVLPMAQPPTPGPTASGMVGTNEWRRVPRRAVGPLAGFIQDNRDRGWTPYLIRPPSGAIEGAIRVGLAMPTHSSRLFGGMVPRFAREDMTASAQQESFRVAGPADRVRLYWLIIDHSVLLAPAVAIFARAGTMARIFSSKSGGR